MYVFGRLRCRQRDETKEDRGGRSGVRLVVSITPAVSSPGLPFLIGAIKKDRLCTKKSLII